jgi:hypothetical protein
MTVEERRSEMLEAEARISGTAGTPVEVADAPAASAATPEPPALEPKAL